MWCDVVFINVNYGNGQFFCVSFFCLMKMFFGVFLCLGVNDYMQDIVFIVFNVEICCVGVDFNGLMMVLGKYLYFILVVVLCELVQNVYDLIICCCIEQFGVDVFLCILVQVDVGVGVLCIIDIGVGLICQEIYDYLVIVGVGYICGLCQGGEDDEGLIGMFGFGFLLVFVLVCWVSVCIILYQILDLGYLYVFSNVEQYIVSEVLVCVVGIEVELELYFDFLLLVNEVCLYEVLGCYCVLLFELIFIGVVIEVINFELLLWCGQGDVVVYLVQVCCQVLQFVVWFEYDFELIVIVLLCVDGNSDVIGLLWVQDGVIYGISDNCNLLVFVCGMLLDDDVCDLLLLWVGFIGGVIEFLWLMFIVSCEDLQCDDQYCVVQYVLLEVLIDGLVDVVKQ